jgi:hypothetical protein
VPLKGLPGHNESEPRAERISADLRFMSLDIKLGWSKVRSFDNWVCLDGVAYRATSPMSRLPHQQQLQPGDCHMRVLPPEGLQQCALTREPHPGKFPDDLPDVPRHGRVDEWNFQSQRDRIPTDGCAYRTAAAMYRLSREQ